MIINNNLLKKIGIVTSISLTLLAIAVFSFLTKKDNIPQKVIVNGVPSPSPTSTTVSTSYPLTIADQKFTIDWNSIKPSFEDGSFTSYFTTPVITDSNIEAFATRLGFTNTNKKELPDNDLIWNKGQETLLYISSNNTLDYQNQKTYTGNTSFIEASLTNKAKQYASSLFPQTPIILESIDYYRDDFYQPTVTDIENSKLAGINFNQTIDGLLLLPRNLSSEHFLTIFITPNLEVQSFRTAPGIQSKQAVSMESFASFDKLKKIPFNVFKKVTPLPIDKESLINNSKELTLTVTQIDIAYTTIGSTAVPLYHVEGTLYGNKIKIGDKVAYVAPVN